MLDGKEIPRFICNEFIQVDKTIEEDTYLLVVLLQLLEREMPFLLRLDHIVHLAQQVYKQNRFMI